MESTSENEPLQPPAVAVVTVVKPVAEKLVNPLLAPLQTDTSNNASICDVVNDGTV
jgi:hypothetical protein